MALSELTALKQAYVAVERLQARLAALERQRTEPIAVIGIGCRFPGGANSPDSFWELLREGRDAIVEVPPGPPRWDPGLYDPDPDAPGKMSTRWCGLLDGVDLFEPAFFGISPREAASLDPQQRLVLEVAWEALERAGRSPRSLAGSATGVFLGMITNDYDKQFLDLRRIDAYFASGISPSLASGRLSYTLGLRGPSLTVDTACSSSLVAVHLACQSLRAGESRLALAGGVNLILHPDVTIGYSKAHMLAADGRCKTFDAAADGFVRGEGCGIVVLKRLSDALADGDTVLAAIRGTAVNQDGSSATLTAPHGPAQEAVIREALAGAGLAAARVDYVETHGTGTALGDPIEVQALAAALGDGRGADRPLLIGSVKTNLGHLEAAAGVAGLIKLILALRHAAIPPHLHFRDPNPHIPWARLPVAVASPGCPWPARQEPRVGAVSSFGFSGTNAHVVVEEAAPPPPRPAPAAGQRPIHVLTVSARTPTALAALARGYAGRLSELPPAVLADVCRTANAGRAHLSQRAALVAESSGEASRLLLALADALPASGAPATGPSPPPAAPSEPPAGVALGHLRGGEAPRIAFLFTGQGSLYPGVGRDLYAGSPVMREVLDRCDARLRGRLERPLLEVLYAGGGEARDAGAATGGGAAAALDDTAYAQPILFALEMALVALWRSWGVEPGALLGHSVGEYAAACAGGVLSLEDGLDLVAERGRLMRDLTPAGAMAAVGAEEETVRAAIERRSGAGVVAVAAANGPRSVTVSGEPGAVASLVAELAGAGYKTESLRASRAFHSPLMEAVLEPFAQRLAAVKLAPPRVRVIPDSTGSWEGGAELASAAYWLRHVREPVRCGDGLATLRDHGYDLLVEIGPAPVLLGLAGRVWPPGAAALLASLRPRRSPWRQMLQSLAALYVRGVEVDWTAFDDGHGRLTELPTYPWERQRHWAAAPPPAIPAGAAAAVPAAADLADAELPGRRLESPALTGQVFESRYTPAWLPYLEDHVVLGRPVVAAASHLVMALAAARRAPAAGPLRVDDFTVPQALLLPALPALATAPPLVQVVIAGDVAAGGASFRLFSRAGGGRWDLHASASLVAAPLAVPSSVDLAAVRERCRQQLDGDQFYAGVAARRIELGSRFRSLDQVWRRDGEALGRLRPSERGEIERYGLPPGVLDSGLQLLVAAFPAGGAGAVDAYLPLGIESFRWHRPDTAAAWCHAELLPGAAGGATVGETARADVRLLGGGGEVVAEALGVAVKRASAAALERAGGDPAEELLYELCWRPLELPGAASSPPPAARGEGSWLVFADCRGVGEALARLMERRGQRCILAHAERPGSLPPPASGRTLDPLRPEAFAPLLAEWRSAGPMQAAVFLWALDLDDEPAGAAAQAPVCGGALHLVQALAAAGDAAPPRLWLATRGGQAIGGDAAAPNQAPLWGLGKVIALEHPELRCRRVDLDPAASAGLAAAALLAEMDAAAAAAEPAAEPEEVGLRAGRRWVPRLAAADRPPPTDGPVRLAISERGLIENLALVPASRRAPGRGEIEVEIAAAGLNFRDLLNVLNLYPGDAGELGSEGVGRVTSVGPEVTEPRPGDEVIVVWGAGLFSSFATVRADCVLRKPPALTAAAAATLPSAFLTAAWGIEHLARLKRGERVLIHAAAGGVGMAAVQLARQAGAEVFATAGSASKRQLLVEQGVRLAMDSRRLDFADQVLAATGGAGVEVVLNSLAGDFIAKSFAALARGGRFVEIGKTDVLTPAAAASLRPDASYFLVDMAAEMCAEPRQPLAVLARVLERIGAGELSPLPLETFPAAAAAAAFRTMAQARHAGKLVLDFARRPAVTPGGPAPRQPGASADGAYLITGGLGALGRHLCRWLARRGARHLVLTGRREGGEEAGRLAAELGAAGVRTLYRRADVARREEAAGVLAAIDAEGLPLRGVFHLAGVLDDGVLAHQTWARFARVLAPKLDGALNLHELTAGRPLELFVLFSSFSSLAGTPGQGNYAAANSYLDALAHRRRGMGLPALAVNWGPWAVAGMAARVSAQDQRRWQSRGVADLAAADGLAALTHLLARPLAQAGVLAVDWRRWLGEPPAGGAGFFSELAAAAQPPAGGAGEGRAAPAAPAVLAQLAATAVERGERLDEILATHVQGVVRRVLGLDPAQPLDPEEPLKQLGLDSLMAVELRNALARDAGRSLPVTLAFDYPTAATVARHLAELLLPPAAAATAPHRPAAGEIAASSDLVAEVAALSEREMEQLIDSELARLGTAGTT